MEGMIALGRGKKMHLSQYFRGVVYTALCGHLEWRRDIRGFSDIDLDNPPSPICKNCLRIHQARKERK